MNLNMKTYCTDLRILITYVLYLSIGDQISQVTTNVRLGFGSFNEKVIQPFSPEPLEVTDPPFGHDRDFPPYAFRHSVNLTADIDEFSVSMSM